MPKRYELVALRNGLIQVSGWIAVLIGLLVFGFSGGFSERLREHQLDMHKALIFSDVYVHHGDNVRDMPFHPGDVMFAHYKIARLVTCNVILQFRLTMVRPGDSYTGLASFSYPLSSYYGPPAQLETNEYFVIPDRMPGHYELRRLNMISCGNNGQTVEFSPAAPLDIVTANK